MEPPLGEGAFVLLPRSCIEAASVLENAGKSGPLKHQHVNNASIWNEKGEAWWLSASIPFLILCFVLVTAYEEDCHTYAVNFENTLANHSMRIVDIHQNIPLWPLTVSPLWTFTVTYTRWSEWVVTCSLLASPGGSHEYLKLAQGCGRWWGCRWKAAIGIYPAIHGYYFTVCAGNIECHDDGSVISLFSLYSRLCSERCAHS